MICINNHIKWVLLVLTLFMVISCSKDNSMGKDDIGSLRLEIPMIEDVSRASTEIGTDIENKIYSLRVLILDVDDNVICNHYVYSESGLTNSVKIDKVPVGFVQMYVIANEESLGMDYSNIETWKNSVVDEEGVKKILFTDKNEIKKFPLRGSVFAGQNTGLPMTWEHKSLEVVPQTEGGEQIIKVELLRAVAKINLNVSHDYTQPIRITDVSFGPFMGDRFYLFKDANTIVPEIPDDAVYSDKDYPGLAIDLPVGISTRTLTLYVYPSSAYKPDMPEPYTVGFKSLINDDVITYPTKPILGADGLPIRQILRNKLININVKISETNTKFDYDVVDWSSETIDVPEFK